MTHEAAIAVLENAKEVCLSNAPINIAEGNFEQAKLEQKNALSYARAIEALKAA